MQEVTQCPRCGSAIVADAPGGMCAACLLQAGLADTRASATDARAAMPSPEELTAILPDLEVHECVGAGGMGAVYRARQTRLDREVAVKILSPDVADSRDFVDRFSREARALATLSHPNIVSVHEYGEAGDMVYIVMEFIEGTNLREIMRVGGLDSAQALTIIQKLCEALQYAHDHGVVHRDIKPENVLLTTAGEIKVVDFGLAKSIGPNRISTLTARVMGTPAYMAPEQFEKPETVDHRADIYSLGVLFYELLTGELPLGRFAAPSEKVEIDVRLDEVVLRTLEKERERRYQRAIDVKTDIHAVRSGNPSPVEPAAPATRSRPAPSKRRGPLYYLAFTAGCLVMAIFGFVFLSSVIGIAVPRLLEAIDRGKAKRTAADLLTISVALDAHRSKYGELPAASSFEELSDVLLPDFAEPLPALDGWTQPFALATITERTATVYSGDAQTGSTVDLVYDIEGDGRMVAIRTTRHGETKVWPQEELHAFPTRSDGTPLGIMFLFTWAIPILSLLGALLVASFAWWIHRRRRARTS